MATTFLTREAPAGRPSRPSLRETVLRDLERVEAYPTLSATAVQVIALADNPDASVGTVANLVRRDGVLAAAVLRAANSWAYRGKTAVNDIQQAVLLLGLSECGRLVSALGVKATYAKHPPAVRERCDVLLRHSLFVARLAAGAAKLTGVSNPGAAFAAGLLHDIGRVVACVRVPEAFAAADPVDFAEDGETLARERDAMGIDHCAVGFQFATKNTLPEGVARAILNHHRPAEEHLQRGLVAVVAVADRVANHVQREHEIAGYDLAACPFFRALADSCSGAQEKALRDGLPDLVVKAIRETRAMLKSTA
jgi:putative nucleotidyltransferase with HDIG domain